MRKHKLLVHFISLYISSNSEDGIAEIGQWLDWMTLQEKHIVLGGDMYGSRPTWGPISTGYRRSIWRALNRGEQIFYLFNVHDLQLINTTTSPPTYTSLANSSHVSWVDISAISKDLHAKD